MELGVKSRSTIWREHEYMVAGFRSVLGGPVVASIATITDGQISNLKLPKMYVRLRGRATLGSLQDLIVYGHVVKQGVLYLDLRPISGKLRIVVSLDFERKILDFNPYVDIELLNGRDAESLQAAIDALTLQDLMTFNATFELRSAERGELLGRMNPYLPVNVDGRATHEKIEAKIAQLGEELAAAIAENTKH